MVGGLQAPVNERDIFVTPDHTNADAFDLLGMEARFDLDAEALERAWLQIAATLHPDVGDGDPQALAQLNQAKAALADPERRAGLLLARLGGPSKEADRTLPPAFLGEMMEIQESIEAARSEAGDLAKWRRWADERREKIIDEVRSAFAALPDPPGSESLKAIRVKLNEWRYVERILEQLVD